jgi:hypothetical protein
MNSVSRVPHKIILLPLLLIAIATCSCQQPTYAVRAAELTGKWKLIFGHDCQGYGIKSDNLLLRSDGTFDQIVAADDGRRFESLGQKWGFMPPSSIAFDRLRNFLVPQYQKELVGAPEYAVLAVQFTSPPTVLIHPHSDCFYAKER